MKKVIFFISFIGFMWACSEPSALDKVYSEEPSEQEAKEIKAELDSAETQILAISILRYKMSGEKLEGLTYQEILDQGKKWKAEDDKRKEETVK